jgi:hypothetical protein
VLCEQFCHSLPTNGLPLGPLLARVRWRIRKRCLSAIRFGRIRPFFFWPNVTFSDFSQYTWTWILYLHFPPFNFVCAVVKGGCWEYSVTWRRTRINWFRSSHHGTWLYLKDLFLDIYKPKIPLGWLFVRNKEKLEIHVSQKLTLPEKTMKRLCTMKHWYMQLLQLNID